MAFLVSQVLVLLHNLQSMFPSCLKPSHSLVCKFTLSILKLPWLILREGSPPHNSQSDSIEAPVHLLPTHKHPSQNTQIKVKSSHPGISSSVSLPCLPRQPCGVPSKLMASESQGLCPSCSPFGTLPTHRLSLGLWPNLPLLVDCPLLENSPSHCLMSSWLSLLLTYF